MSRETEHEENGWYFHDEPRGFDCGYCGTHTTTQFGLARRECRDTSDGLHEIRLCTKCHHGTNMFFDLRRRSVTYQFPSCKRGMSFKAKAEPEDVRLIVILYDEARQALSLGAPNREAFGWTQATGWSVWATCWACRWRSGRSFPAWVRGFIVSSSP